MPETNHCRREGGRKGAAPDPINEIVSLRYSPDGIRESKEKDTHKLIVEVAERLFRQIGFQKTTVADIARREPNWGKIRARRQRENGRLAK
jgi:hypothetical protein